MAEFLMPTRLLLIQDDCQVLKVYLTSTQAHYSTNLCYSYSPLPHPGNILYSGKLSREKTFANFAVLWLYTKVFSAKFGVRHPSAWQKRAIRESFLLENRIFTNSRKFSLSLVSRYTVCSFTPLTRCTECTCVHSHKIFKAVRVHVWLLTTSQHYHCWRSAAHSLLSPGSPSPLKLHFHSLRFLHTHIR